MNLNNNLRNISRRSLLVMMTVTYILTACKRDPEEKEQYDFLLTYEKVNSLSQSLISSMYMIYSAQYPEMLDIMNNTQYDVDIYKITYKSNYRDSSITASGVVCIPLAAGAFPIISFQNGTNTSHAEAPSTNIMNPFFTLLQSLAGNGYILLIPDYIGFGSSEDIVHPYHQKESNNNAILDMLFASREFLDNYEGEATFSEICCLMGYSLGGWATLSALKEIESDPTIGLTVIATSCGAGAYDLISVADEIIHQESYPGPLYLPYYIYSHQQYGSVHDPLGKFFREPYSGIIPELFNGNYTNGEVNDQLTDTMADLLAADLIENFKTSDEYSELRDDLIHNSIEAWELSSLVRLYHGNADDNVPVNQSISMYNNFLEHNNDTGTVHYSEMEGLNHETGILPWGINSVIWFNEILSEK